MTKRVSSRFPFVYWVMTILLCGQHNCIDKMHQRIPIDGPVFAVWGHETITTCGTTVVVYSADCQGAMTSARRGGTNSRDGRWAPIKRFLAGYVKAKHLCVRNNTQFGTETISEHRIWRRLRQEADQKGALLHRSTTLWIITANTLKFWATAERNKTSELCA